MNTNPQIRVCLAGPARDTEPFFRAWRTVPTVEVYDASGTDRTTLREGSHGRALFRSLDALLAAGPVDILHICTPDVPAASVRAALERGCDVLLTPPLAFPEPIINDIERLARKHGVRVWPLHLWRFLPGAARAAEFAALGALGALEVCELRNPPDPGVWTGLFPGPCELEAARQLQAWAWADFCNWLLGPPESPGAGAATRKLPPGPPRAWRPRCAVSAVTGAADEVGVRLDGSNATLRYRLRLAADGTGPVRELLTVTRWGHERSVRIPQSPPLPTALAYAAFARSQARTCLHVSLAEGRNALKTLPATTALLAGATPQ